MSQCGKITCKIFDSCNFQYIGIKANKRCFCTTTLYYSFKSKNITVTTKNTISLIQPTFLPLTFWSLSETFIRRTEEVWLILLPVLATIVMRRGKKSVVPYVWPAATVLDRESDKSTWWIKEAVYIRNEGRRSLNRDEGSYTLSHTYDRLLAKSHHYRGKNRNWLNFFWWRSLAETETSKEQMLLVLS